MTRSRSKIRCTNYIIQHQLLAAFILQNWDTLPLALSKETKQSLSLSNFKQFSTDKKSIS